MSDAVTLKMVDGSERLIALANFSHGVGVVCNRFVLMTFHRDGTIQREDQAKYGNELAIGWATSNGRIIIDGPPTVFHKPKNPNTVDVARALGFNTWASREITDEEARDLLALIPAHIKQEGGSK